MHGAKHDTTAKLDPFDPIHKLDFASGLDFIV